MIAADWSGDVGAAWAAAWRETDLTFAPVDAALVDRAMVGIGDERAPRILDIGCGAGATGLAIAARCTAADIVGIDLSPALVAVASERSKSDPRLRFVAADATRYVADRPFDLLASRHGVMFFDDPVAAFAHLRSLARPGATLVFSCFRARVLNPWAERTVALLPQPPAPPRDPVSPGPPGPFAFADDAPVAALLAAAGWREARAEPLDYDYVVGVGPDPVAAARGFFQRIGPVAAALRALDAEARADTLARLDAVLAEYRDGDRIVMPAAAWLWTARA